VRKGCIVRALLVAILTGGCSTPAVYEGAPLPRFLVDTVPTPPLESGLELPPVPVADRSVVTLPDAVRECVLNSLQLRSGEEQVRLAQADYVTQSLIPNCQLFADAQLLPLTPISLVNQGGPPQYDAYLTMPIDWFLFGKRVAARAAARLNVDAAQATYADQVRQEITQTVNTFYDVLEADATVKATEDALNALRELEKKAREREKAGKSAIERRRVRLAVHDVQRDLRKWRAAARTARAKLAALIGRPPGAAGLEVQGTLAVRAVAPSLSVQQAWSLAEENRPDLIAARRSVAAADAAIDRERRKAYPALSVLVGPDYQDQVTTTGFRNPWLWTVAVTSTLPFTDRNQGGILSAEATARQARSALGLALAQARADVEQALAEYAAARKAVTGEDAVALRTAREVRDAVRAAHRKGEQDFSDLLDAERAYHDRVRTTLSNLKDYWQALNRVNAAVGLRVVSAQEAEALIDEPGGKGTTP
jgi:cobalt-zinc-cadmium efflux system outer membrane protein